MRLLAIHAHPDDESSKGAATMARYAAEGHEVTVVTCTGGERGDVLNPEFAPVDDLPAQRRKEMAAAVEILGVDHEWLGFVDSGMGNDGPPPGSFAAQPLEVPVAAMVAVIRRRRPHAIISYDESGGYPHPDHVMTHRVAIAAFTAAADPAAYPEHGAAWRTAKLYYVHLVTKESLRAFHESMLHAGLTSPLTEWLENWDDRGNLPVTTHVECASFYETRNRALLAHRSQVSPQDGWFRIPLEIQERSWPTEDYQLALSYVDTEFPETSLFAGLGGENAADRLGTVTGPRLVIDVRVGMSA